MQASLSGGQRLAAIMFTDMVGYTSLTQSNEAGTMKLLEEHREILRPCFAKHGGVEVKTIGDAFLVEFASSLDAVRCALEIQRRVSGDGGLRARLRLRIGIHLGEVIHSGGDVYGDAVNVAARIEPLAEPGGVCISRQVFELVQNKVDAQFNRQGMVELKNVRSPVEIYKTIPVAALARSTEMSSPLKMRVAVLPLDNFSPEAGDEYFADGLTEEMIGTLSKIRELSVISRTSVMQYKGKPKLIPDISRELNAGTILEGSVRKAGTRARVSIQMIDATEDRHLWAENYDRDLQDIFSVQSEIAGKVAEALKLELLADEKKAIDKAPTMNVQANLLFLKGIYEFDKGRPSDMLKAADYFQQAIELDPTFSVAYSTRAACYISVAGETLPGAEAFPKAEKDVERALDLDPGSWGALASRGWLAFQYEWNWPKAEVDLKRAIELAPGQAGPHARYGRVLGSLGRFEEALSELKVAHDLDPADPWIMDHLGMVNYMAGDNREAREWFNRLLEQDSKFVKARLGLAFVSAAEGKAQDAKVDADATVALDAAGFFQIQRAMVHATVGSASRTREILANVLSGKYEGYVAPAEIAGVYYCLGDSEKGYEWMKKALAERDPTLPWTCTWPIMSPAKKDPRFVEMLEQLGLPSR